MRILPRLVLLLAALPWAHAENSPTSAATNRISGKVVNASSEQPLASTQVSIYATGDFHLVHSVTTAEDGRFFFDQLPAGKFMLQGERQGFVTSAYDQHDGFNTAIATGEGLASENLVLRLIPDGMISGLVTDEAGEPVRQARLTLYAEDTQSGVGGVRQTIMATTDDTGAYELPHLRPGNYFLAASAFPWYANHPSTLPNPQDPNGPPATRSPLDVVYPTAYYSDATDSDSATPIPIKGGDDLTINFTLHPVPALHILVHLPEPRPEGASMPILQHSVFGAMEPVPENIQFAAPGLVEIAGVAVGQYSLQISNGAGSPGRVITLDASSDQQVDSTAGKSLAEVSGTVQGAPPPAPGQQLVIGLSQPGKPNFQPVGADRAFQFKDLAPGSYEVVAASSGRAVAVDRITATNASVEGHQITVTGDQEASLEITLREASATIQGIAKHLGKPAAGAMVVLVPRDPDTNQALFRRDQSDSDGTFGLLAVTPGDYTVVAIQDGWTLDWAKSEVLARFLPKGEKVTVPAAPGRIVKLPAAVEVQPREPAP